MNAKRKRRGIYRVSKRCSLIRIRRRRCLNCCKKSSEEKTKTHQSQWTDFFNKKGEKQCLNG